MSGYKPGLCLGGWGKITEKSAGILGGSLGCTLLCIFLMIGSNDCTSGPQDIRAAPVIGCQMMKFRLLLAHKAMEPSWPGTTKAVYGLVWITDGAEAPDAVPLFGGDEALDEDALDDAV